MKKDARKLQKEASAENATIKQLKEALETLTKAKEEYEKELLTKVLSPPTLV